MSEYTDEQVNIGIAEFMGYTTESIDGVLYEFEDKGGGLCDLGCSPMYTKSLDALVPVWDKIKTTDRLTLILSESKKVVAHFNARLISFKDNGDHLNVSCPVDSTVQKTAALATYKAILALGEK